MRKKVRGLKLSIKITLTTMLIAIAVSVLIGVISINYMEDYLLNASRDKTMAMAESAANIIDADQIARIEAGDEGSEDHLQVLAQLQGFLVSEDIEYIYTMRQVDGVVQFVVDADTEEGAAIGEEYETYDKIDMALAGESSMDDEVTTDEWGSFYSAFAPIVDAEGNVVAIVGVDCSVDSIDEKVADMTKTLVMVEVICVVAAFFISMIMGHVMARNVLKINRKMEELAGNEGDLTQEIQIHSGDEIENVANSFNSFMVKLRTMMLSVKDSGDKLEDNTNQTNRELQEATEELNQISGALNGMTETMQETSESVTEIEEAAVSIKQMSEELYEKTMSGAEYADNVSETADEARKTCQSSKEQMSQIVGEMSQALNDTIEDSVKIDRIIELTNDIISISEQTQLLALNASIEAARAGEEGKGFAVVAGEVSKLADATAQTAMEIESINQFTVDTVNALVNISKQMIDYVDNVISTDYDRMVEIGQAYHQDSREFKSQFDDFCKLAEQLSLNMETIENNISKIMEVIEVETASISDVADVSDKIYGKMQNASSNSEVNEEIVGELGDMLDKFIV
ncbi:MAG: HAMP domain-containing protein [Lachnospiraceae bacterium]|nr:HAMP domain-containing protein [Lachnospiraceae bacterium]